MNWDTFLTESERTAAVNLSPKFTTPQAAVHALVDCCQDLDLVGNYKRMLVAGKPAKPLKLPPLGFFHPGRERELHALLGMASEMGELIEATFEDWNAPTVETSDKVNDEVGDWFWYFAMFCRARGINLERVLAENIAKLRVRFPDKFDPDRVNADDAERVAAEKAAQAALREDEGSGP